MEPVAAKFLALATLAALVPWPHREIRQSVPLAPEGRLFLRAAGGTVEIAGWDRAAVEIDARIEPRTPLASQRACIDDTRIRVDSWPRSLRLTADFPAVEEDTPWWLAALTGRCAEPPVVHYRIRMPREAGLTLVYAASKIRLHGLAGPVEIRTAAARQ